MRTRQGCQIAPLRFSITPEAPNSATRQEEEMGGIRKSFCAGNVVVRTKTSERCYRKSIRINYRTQQNFSIRDKYTGTSWIPTYHQQPFRNYNRKNYTWSSNQNRMIPRSKSDERMREFHRNDPESIMEGHRSDKWRDLSC